MIIVSDTSPLRYLIELDVIDILPKMFGKVFTTPVVFSELQMDHFPPNVKRWAASPPDWLKIASPKHPIPTDQRIHPGEAEAISLAMESSADRLLMDDTAGVELAKSMNLKVIRTLTHLSVAGELGLIPLAEILQRLTTETRFRATPALIATILNPIQSVRESIRNDALWIRKNLPIEPPTK